jgi:hypothetical protein
VEWAGIAQWEDPLTEQVLRDYSRAAVDEVSGSIRKDLEVAENELESHNYLFAHLGSFQTKVQSGVVGDPKLNFGFASGNGAAFGQAGEYAKISGLLDMTSLEKMQAAAPAIVRNVLGEGSSIEWQAMVDGSQAAYGIIKTAGPDGKKLNYGDIFMDEGPGIIRVRRTVAPLLNFLADKTKKEKIKRELSKAYLDKAARDLGNFAYGFTSEVYGEKIAPISSQASK